MSGDGQREPHWRLFIAAPVPAAAAHELFDKMADFRRRYSAARWAKVDQLHATLVFLGQVPAGEVDRLTAAVEVAADRLEPFEAETGESGGRTHDRRDGVAWLRVDRGATELAALAIEVDRLVGSNEYRNSPPRPHITVARRVDNDFLRDLRADAPSFRTRWVFDRVGLYRSYSEPGGSRYETLAMRLLTPVEATA